jgi:hypothetical protein
MNKPTSTDHPLERSTKTSDAAPRTGTVRVERKEGETDDQAAAREMLNPSTRHTFTALPFLSCLLGKSTELPDAVDFSDAIKANAEQVQKGNFAFVSSTLAAQAVALDAIFGEFSRRAALNMNNYLEAAERYMRLALKAQANSRATMEALAKLHQPREQIVRHIHVNEGGQAIVAEQVHHYRTGVENAGSVKQSHATEPAGERTALPGEDAEGERVPITGSQRQEAVQNARRHKSRRA